MKDSPQLKYPRLLITDGRKSGSSSIIDEEDLRILSILNITYNLDTSNNNHANSLMQSLHNFSKKESSILKEVISKNKKGLYLADIEKYLSISRKSLLDHLNKLERFSWVKLERSLIPGEYKQKILSITPLGINCFELLCESNTFFEDENGDLVINTPR